MSLWGLQPPDPHCFSPLPALLYSPPHQPPSPCSSHVLRSQCGPRSEGLEPHTITSVQEEMGALPASGQAERAIFSPLERLCKCRSQCRWPGWRGCCLAIRCMLWALRTRLSSLSSKKEHSWEGAVVLLVMTPGKQVNPRTVLGEPEPAFSLPALYLSCISHVAFRSTSGSLLNFGTYSPSRHHQSLQQPFIQGANLVWPPVFVLF